MLTAYIFHSSGYFWYINIPQLKLRRIIIIVVNSVSSATKKKHVHTHAHTHAQISIPELNSLGRSLRARPFPVATSSRLSQGLLYCSDALTKSLSTRPAAMPWRHRNHHGAAHKMLNSRTVQLLCVNTESLARAVTRARRRWWWPVTAYDYFFIKWQPIVLPKVDVRWPI